MHVKRRLTVRRNCTLMFQFFLSFRRGSVVVLFNLTFTRDMANELGANVTNNLVNAVRTGSLGELAVGPNSLIITQTGKYQLNDFNLAF